MRAEIGDRVLLSFSRGKDSLATWLSLREAGFKVVPFFKYWVPGLSFVEESLAYYEQFFGVRIIRLPDPLFWNHLNEFVLQPPERVATIRSFNIPKFDDAILEDALAAQLGMSPYYSALGMRLKENIDRRNLIFQKGVLGQMRRRYFYPIWDWSIKQVAEIITRYDVKLAPDYLYWGRTLSAWDYEYLAPLKWRFPEDYERLRTWFPMADIEFFRYEVVNETAALISA